MATISGLPNELLVEIWRHILLPEDIESFAQASKQIHAVSGPFLLEHRKLKHKFTTFSNGNLLKKPAAGLLKEITINPHVAPYVTSLVITSWRDRWDDVHPWRRVPNKLVAFIPDEEYKSAPQYVHSPYEEEDMIIFEHAAKRAEHVFGNVDSLIKGIKEGKEDPIIALLLLQLTNLNDLLFLVDAMEDTYHFLRVLQYASNATGTEALRRLITVILEHTLPYGSRNDEDLRLVTAFATLPSVKRIHGRTIRQATNHRDLAVNLQARSSNVEDLTFHCEYGRARLDQDANESGGARMDLDANAFFELIEGFKGLKTFEYKCQVDSEPFWVHAALVAHAKHSLETLILRSRHHCKEPIGSFRSFEVLKKLELDHTYLVEERGSQFTRLAGTLPSSLEELHLHDVDMGSPRRLDPLWAGQEILEDKDTHLPNLSVVVFCDDFLMTANPFLEPGLDRAAPGIADLQAACNAKGFRLEIPERRPDEFGRW